MIKPRDTPGPAEVRPAITAPEETCGQELARDAEVPESLGLLMSHVAKNMEAHARWVGTSSPAGAGERAAMEQVAAAYHAIATAAAQAAAAMRAMRELPPAPHDPAKWDRPGQARWMREKISMQRDFAAMILRHAQDSEAALAGLERRPPPPPPRK